jgi:hypothetical protein
MSMMKSLPEDHEIFAEGCSDAGELFIMLRQAGRYGEFLSTHPAKWSTPPSEPSEDRVGNMCYVLLRIVESHLGLTGTSEGLRRKDVNKFQKMRLAQLEL